MRRFLAIILALMLAFSLVSCSEKKEEPQLKYIFMFIGDGMSLNTVQLARDTIAARRSETQPSQLSFTDFESVGIFTNYDRSSFIPDSASSGTAMATGIKTDSGMIAQSSAGAPVESIATTLKRVKNMKVGIITTANMNHATPGVFYGHSASRYNYYEIGSYLPTSGFDLFIGGQFLDPEGGGENLVSLAQQNGYTYVDNYDDIVMLTDRNQKYLITDPWCDSSGMMSFDIDRPENALTLADYLTIGTDLLYNDNGFFIMCEGGRIDSALHANDARTAVDELEAFSDAVNVALDFYEEHPDETLILVTGDHETGGLSLGSNGTDYTAHFDKLYEQKLSYLKFEKDYVDKYKAEKTPFETVLQDVGELFGLTELKQYEMDRLLNAWEKTLAGKESYTEADTLSFSNRTPLTVEVTRLVGLRAGVGFSTLVHTASTMGMWAKGVHSELFEGSYDNTDIYSKLYTVFFK